MSLRIAVTAHSGTAAPCAERGAAVRGMVASKARP